MKYALMIDKTSQKSFYIENRKAYNFHDKRRFNHQHCITLENISMTQGLFSIPFVFGEDGYYIQLQEFERGGYPELDLDVIFLNTEKSWDFDFSKLRKAYPNAVIIAILKEHNPLLGVYNQNTIDLYKNADVASVQYFQLKLFKPFMQLIGKSSLYRLQQPYPVDWLYSNYGEKRSAARHKRVMLYKPSNDPGQAVKRGYELSSKFIRMLNRYYGAELEYVYPDAGQSWDDFLKVTASCGWCINLDPVYMVGQQPIQCGALKTFNIGGLTDAHLLLWNETASVNESALAKVFDAFYKDRESTITKLDDIYKKTKELYSFEAFRETLQNILKEI